MAGNENEAISYEIKIGSKTFKQQGAIEEVDSHPARVSVESYVDAIGVAKVTFENPGVDLTITAGDPVEVKFNDKVVFTGLVTGFEVGFRPGMDEVTVVALDPLCKLAASRATKFWEKKKDSDCVKAVIGEAGATAGTVDATSETPEYTFMRNESYLSFAKRMAARNGYLLRASKEGKVEFVKPSFSGTAVEIGHSEIRTLEYRASFEMVPPKAKGLGWDYVQKKAVTGEASSTTVVGSGSSAVSAKGIWHSAGAPVADMLVTTDGAAKAAAQSALDRHAMRFLTGRLVTAGRADIVAGAILKLNCTGAKYNPTVYVSGAIHTFDSAGGYLTEAMIQGNALPEEGKQQS